MTQPPLRVDRIITLLVLAVLIGGVFLVLRPFLTAILWAAILVVTTWPMYRWLQAKTRSPNTAATLMTLLIMIVAVSPFVIAGTTLAENAERLVEFTRSMVARGPPDAPTWLKDLPLVGPRAAEYWGSFSHDGAALLTELRRLADPMKDFLFKGGAQIGSGLIQLTFSVFIAFFFFRDGEGMRPRIRGAVSRIAPIRGIHMLDLAGDTTRAVVYGILGTALAQGVLMGIGLYVAGIKAAPLLGLVTFFLSPIPVGPPLVWLAAAVWLFSEGQNGWAIFILAWGALVVSSIDNVLKPLIISRGSDLPFVLVLLGVLGGVVAFGFIGIFLGPVLLALGYALVKEWAAPALDPTPAVVTDDTVPDPPGL
ncbi:MAG: AI-2E family transporter [Betaproteobacteria bacterium]